MTMTEPITLKLTDEGLDKLTELSKIISDAIGTVSGGRCDFTVNIGMDALRYSNTHRITAAIVQIGGLQNGVKATVQRRLIKERLVVNPNGNYLREDDDTWTGGPDDEDDEPITY